MSGRLVMVTADGAVDVAKESDGHFDSDPQAVFDRWQEFCDWAAKLGTPTTIPMDVDALLAPVQPRQVFGVGLNYGDHIAESGFAKPEGVPSVFTKFPSCITGPTGDIRLPAGGHTDWEVELAVVIGRRAAHVPADEAWAHVAGLTVGQDISERKTQLAGQAPQFSLGKSFDKFGPLGPWIVTPDEFDNPNDLRLGCSVNGEVMQEGRTSSLIFTISDLVEKISAIVTLLPGDVIFTGTPAGVGAGRTPPRWLRDGDVLTSYIEGIGEMQHRFVA